MRSVAAAALLLGLLATPVAAATPAPRDVIVGTWRGTSLCVDKATDTACHDERVIYEFRTLPAAPDSVELSASKRVGSSFDPMGVFVLGYDRATHSWSTEFFSRRYHGRWEFRIRRGVMSGTLVDLPSRRLVRRVRVVKDR